MSKKIIGATVGTPISPDKIKEKIKPVTSVNGLPPNEKGDVNVSIDGESVKKALGYTPVNQSDIGDQQLETQAQTVRGAINELKRDSNLTKITSNTNSEIITLSDAVNDGYESLALYGKSTQDGTPTPEAPVPIVSVGNDGTATVTSCGKNLLVQTCVVETKNGVTFTPQEDGSIIMNGTATGDVMYNIYTYQSTDTPFLLSNDVYTVSFGSEFGEFVKNNSDTAKLVVGRIVAGTTNSYAVFEARATATFSGSRLEGSNKIFVRIRLWAGAVCDNVRVYPQIELGSTATTYEPYNGTTATLTTALPLCSVGDVKDELIFSADGTGKVVKKTHKINSYAGEPIDGAFMSSTGELSEGATVVYALATPEEIDLTVDEVTALKSLMSYKGTTNVFNDESAEMTVEYPSVMKSYIDGCFGEVLDKINGEVL